MSMLITERAVITPQKTARVRPVAPTTPLVRSTPEVVAPVVSLVLPRVQVNPIKRQNWLLLTLVMLPLAGAIWNLATFGWMR
jgi:hypothetical protein